MLSKRDETLKNSVVCGKRGRSSATKCRRDRRKHDDMSQFWRNLRGGERVCAESSRDAQMWIVSVMPGCGVNAASPLGDSSQGRNIDSGGSTMGSRGQGGTGSSKSSLAPPPNLADPLIATSPHQKIVRTLDTLWSIDSQEN